MFPLRKADLHIHSWYSDSDLSVKEIFIRAKERNLSCISITDHDTTQAQEEGRIISHNYGVEFIEGIEISAEREGTEIHILGYFIDYHNEQLVDYLKEIKDVRKERLITMAKKIVALGVEVDIDELLEGIKDKIPTRLHLALYLVQKGKVNSIWDAFRKYLSPRCPAYVSRFRLTVKEAIEVIKGAGGIAILAHPHFLPKEEWIEEFVSYGLRGLEVVYPRYTPKMIAHYNNIAEKLGLLKSGGGDSHGSYKEFTQIGGVNIPYEWVQELKEAKQETRRWINKK